MAARQSWSGEGVRGLRAERSGEGGRASSRLPDDQIEALEAGCVTFWGVRGGPAGGALVVTVWPERGQAAAGAPGAGESAWGDYDAEFGLVTFETDEGGVELVVHEATEAAVARAAAACAGGHVERAVARAGGHVERAAACAGGHVERGGGREGWGVEPGVTAFLPWRDGLRGAGLPDEGDERELAHAVQALAGRAPTGREREAFEAAFFERLWLRCLELSGARAGGEG
ncbi:MAG TPA: hypothetical protein VFS43_47455 [Polyangiaceae bacterium]|nr:hypothetical protein [Polyangiaceae bacterium]